MPVELFTVKGVKLAKVGDWPVERGYGRFSEADIESMAVHAALNPRLKVRHLDKGPGALPIWGQATNLRAEVDPDDGVLTLVGDYVNVPKPLAEVLPTSLPGRSIEAVRNRKMPDGSTAPMVATAVALLSDEEPAMSTLGDHPTIEGLHAMSVAEADLVIHAARILSEMEPVDLAHTLMAGVDSAGELHATKDEIVPDENTETETAPATQPVEDPKPDAAPAPTEPAEAPATETEGDEETADPAEAPGVVTLPEGVVAIDAKVLEQLQADAKLGREANDQLVAAGRASVLDSAINEGRIAPASRSHYERLHAADPEGTEALIATLTPGTIPVHAERGHAGDPESLSTDDDVMAAYEARYGKTEA